MWLGAIGPSVYFVPNKSKKSVSIYVPLKPTVKKLAVTKVTVTQSNVQYLMQVAPGQYVSVTVILIGC